MGLALFCMSLLSVLKRTREELDSKCVEAFTYLDGINTEMVDFTSNTVEVVPFL